MIRTQMYLDDKLYKALKQLAKKKKKSMAEVTRELLEEAVEKKTTTDTSGIKVLQRLIDLKLTGGPNDLAKNHDHYLYGGPKKK